MMALWYIGAFVLAIGILVTVHEFGHYWVARRCGVRILRFSIGFGRPLMKWQRGADSTEWVLGAIPLGGYVKMLDEREAPVAPEWQSQAFNRKPVAQRIAIVAAGPLANFLLAILLYWLLFMTGVRELAPLLAAPLPDSPAAIAGIRAEDRVVDVAGKEIESWSDLRWELVQRGSEKAQIVLNVIDIDGVRRTRSIDASAIRLDEGVDIPKDLGLGVFRPPMPPVIGKVVSSSAAERAGIKVGDRVISIDGKPIADWDALVEAVSAAPGRALAVTIVRDGASLELRVTPEAHADQGRTTGRIGVGIADNAGWQQKLIVEIKHAPPAAMMRAIRQTWETSTFSLRMLGRMLTGEISARNISGPVTIADYAGQSARLGLDAYLRFLALISISIGLLNLFPIPLLDGGHIMYYLVEIVIRRPLSERVMEIGQQIGFAALAMLMAFALFNDVTRLLS